MSVWLLLGLCGATADHRPREAEKVLTEPYERLAGLEICKLTVIASDAASETLGAREPRNTKYRSKAAKEGEERDELDQWDAQSACSEA